ncbi:hypothetical protein D3C83_260120 [compost metagenome]
MSTKYCQPAASDAFLSRDSKLLRVGRKLSSAEPAGVASIPVDSAADRDSCNFFLWLCNGRGGGE